MATSIASISDLPPPYYLERDPDHISLRSAAPSYTSSVPPSYTPLAGPNVRTSSRTNMIYSSLIPSGLSPTPAHYAYNVASWPSLSNHSQSRAYLNVAARRAQRERDDEAIRRALSSTSSIAIARTLTSSESTHSTGTEQRLTGRDEALRMEGRAWDFFTTQISDWDHRQASWRAFKARCELGGSSVRHKKKGRKSLRLGFYGRLG